VAVHQPRSGETALGIDEGGIRQVFRLPRRDLLDDVVLDDYVAGVMFGAGFVNGRDGASRDHRLHEAISVAACRTASRIFS
jgi:hypothetical protein